MRLLASLLPEGHGPPEPLFRGDAIAGAKLRDLQLRVDADQDEVVCVRWRGLEREVLLTLDTRAASTRAAIQALFDATYPRTGPSVDV